MTFLTITLMLAGCTTTADVSGTVRDLVRGTGVAGVNVRVEQLGKSVSTDEDGTFTLENVPAGSYLVSVSPAGFTTSETRFEIKDDGTFEPVKLDVVPKPDHLGAFLVTQDKLLEIKQYPLDRNIWSGVAAYAGTIGFNKKSFPQAPQTSDTQILIYDKQNVSSNTFSLWPNLSQNRKDKEQRWVCNAKSPAGAPTVKDVGDNLYLLSFTGLRPGGYCMFNQMGNFSYLFWIS